MRGKGMEERRSFSKGTKEGNVGGGWFSEFAGGRVAWFFCFVFSTFHGGFLLDGKERGRGFWFFWRHNAGKPGCLVLWHATDARAGAREVHTLQTIKKSDISRKKKEGGDIYIFLYYA